jgi:hypothetical protein
MGGSEFDVHSAQVAQVEHQTHPLPISLSYRASVIGPLYLRPSVYSMK